jgi:hypothetical protein
MELHGIENLKNPPEIVQVIFEQFLMTIWSICLMASDWLSEGDSHFLSFPMLKWFLTSFIVKFKLLIERK